jgi:hypothetical protein
MGHELRRARWVFLGLVFFAISSYFVYREVVYLLTGRQTTATVTKVLKVTTTRRGVSRDHLEVHYQFTEPNGTPRTGHDTQGTEQVPPIGSPVAVQYTPGPEGHSRFSGRVDWIWLVLFFVSICVIGVFLVKLLLEAREATRPRKKKRRRYD